MKKLIVILLTSSFALAMTANAAQDNPKSKKPKTGPVQRQNIAPKQHFAPKLNAAPKSSHVEKVHSRPNLDLKTKTHETNVSKSKLHQSTMAATTNNAPNVKSTKQPATNAQTNQLPAVQNNQKNMVAPNTKPVPNIQNIQAKYKNFKAQPKPAVVPSVQFNQNYRIAGAENWSGPQYRVFSSYHPQWHDRGWWQSTYGANVLLIGGGWYYWNAGYWYPAWGYDTSASYYPYDGPIYVGEHRRPFDEVVADAQASLQEQGYYHGEVDGLMGPQTRQALADFQRDHGLITTAAMDEPTLASLGLG